MKKIGKSVKELCEWVIKNEDGGETVEYPVVLAAVAIIGIPTLILLGIAVGNLVTRVNDSVGTI